MFQWNFFICNLGVFQLTSADAFGKLKVIISKGGGSNINLSTVQTYITPPVHAYVSSRIK